MTPHYCQTNLDAYLAAVPLTVPVPPGPPSEWTCLYSLLGGNLAFAITRYQEVAPDTLLRELLRLAGRPCGAEESRPLLLVTPIVAPHGLVPLVRRAVHGSQGFEAIGLLGHLGGAEVEALLIERLEEPELEHREAVVTALGRMRSRAEALAQWDGETDAARLWAAVRTGRLPSALPEGPLEALAGFVPELDPAAARTVLEGLDSLDEGLVDVVAEVFCCHAGLAAELAEALVPHLARAVDRPRWADAIAGAGEEIVDGVVGALGDEDWRMRMGAVIVLGVMADAGDRGLAALRTALSDGDPDVRREAALALARRGHPGPVESWSDNYGFIERASALPWGDALTGGVVPLDLFALLTRRDNGAVLARACLALAFAHPRLAAPALEALCVDPGYDVPLEARQAAAAGLMATGVAPDRLPALHRVLLCGIGQGTQGSVEGVAAEDLVVVAARDGDWQVRYAALGLLERTGQASRYDGLLAVLEAVDSDSDVRQRATALRAAPYRAPSPADVLARLVTSSRIDDAHRSRALQELADTQPSLAGALAPGLLDHHDRGTAVTAARIAGATASTDSVSTRVQEGLAGLRAPEWIRREASAALLGSLDPGSLDLALFEELVEALEAAALGDDDRDVQQMAQWAAGRLKRRRG